MHFFFKEYNLNDSYAGFWWSCRDRGESDKRCFCGLISAILAKSPAIIMVGNLFDLSSSFCMFGFYLIMFYSNPLLRTFCLACLCHCIKNNDKKKHFTGYPNDTSILFDFPLILCCCLLSEIARLRHEVMGPVWHWWRSLSRGQPSIFISMPFRFLS